MSSILSKILLAIVKKALSVGGGSLVADGWLTNDQNTQAVGAIMTLVGIAWEVVQMVKTRKTEKYASAAAATLQDLTGSTAPLIPVVRGEPLSVIR